MGNNYFDSRHLFLKIWYLNKGRKIELNRDGFIYNDKKSEKIIEWRGSATPRRGGGPARGR